MVDWLAAAIARHSDGRWSDTAVPRLTVVALDEPVAPADLLYEPMVCFIAGGAKRTVAGDRSWVAGRGEMFLNSLALPVTCVFEQVPYRSAVLRLDSRVLADLLLELDGSSPRPQPHPAGQGIARMTPELLDAVTRWVRLLDAPEDIRPLAARTESEILYRLLGSPLGPHLRQFALADSGTARVREAAGWISAHYTEPLTVEEIAAVAHMSTATLHRHFKAATGMSPLRFQRHLRLQEARRRLVAGGTTAALVAEAVGYASPTQFSREYRRAYGLPPARDAAHLRGRMESAATP
ncbi:AraC family transcriptional regulator [Streptomyces lunaelactis]|uniref:AraC family transcriptional regulator n=1 Tax=Streptomyces lunaelactis TaxID=1535768 RepID=UPI0015851456|nr:AraC family transcriptional regulator [Streptomyces lunaelactis]NUK10849.1 AraC family transcriptional regulator [Streptomyces lunaelactis]NUL12627.1 AraC family transcriptional regulator [Streptomyces lunaelactis]NUL25325.1 AraC family transcriptional regulator [Streptomyces lunaelactis]